MSYQAKAAQTKKDTVEEFTQLMKEYPIVGVCNLESLPAPQEQTIRAKLRGKVVIKMTKKRLMQMVFDQCKSQKENVDKLAEYLRGMPALLFTKENPFSLFKTIKQNQSPAPAKPGQIAPKDIVVPAGPTGFAPGPVIGELGALGIKSKVDGGKIAILEDTLVCKEGEEISEPLASMLSRLNINPMSVGLDLVAVWEDGDIMTRSVLDIDEDKFMADLEQAARWAFNLSCEAVIPTEHNRELLIAKAFRDAKGLALECNIMADAVAEELVTKAERQANSLRAEAKIEVPPPGAKAEKKEEPNPEEAKEGAEQAPAEKEQALEAEQATDTGSSNEEKESTSQAPKAEEKPNTQENNSQSTDQKVEEMVKKQKDFDDGNIPKAQDIVDNSQS